MHWADRRRRRFVGTLMGLSLPGTSAAQETLLPAQPATQQRDELGVSSDIVVLGNRVRGSAIGDVQSTAVLDRQAIKSLVAMNLDEVLKRVKGLTTASNGGDPAFLLNGRRVSSFGEMRSIPPEAIERMEILPEQEAARFGFPATVKVVNLITKARLQAVTAQEVVSTATDGGGTNAYVETTSTRIDGGRRTSLSVSYAWQDPILQSQRRIIPDSDTVFALGGNVTGVGGASIDPAFDVLADRAVTVVTVPEHPELRGLLESYVPQANEPAITDIGRYRTLMQKMDTVRVDGTIASPLGRT